VRWYLAPYRQYASFSGRADRAEYWTYSLVNSAILIVLRILADTSTTLLVIDFAFLALTLLPTIAVTVRRLHDTDRSGWFVLLVLVPVLGWALLLTWTLQPSGDPNQHGHRPGHADADPVDDRAAARRRAESLADWQL
jgi:uncharacterized membrane protein YhaH (DUF805 family)